VIFPTIDPNTVEFFRFVNSFAPWAASIVGTVGIGVSIWLGLRNNFLRLKLDVDLATPPISKGPTVRISVANIGTRKANLVRAYVKSGAFRKIKQIPLIHQLRTDPTLPAVLEDGGVVGIDFTMDALALQLKTDFRDTAWWNGGAWLGWFLRTVKIGIVTSTGKAFEVRLRPQQIDGFMGTFRLAGERL
jgi:hypothetical protein